MLDTYMYVFSKYDLEWFSRMRTYHDEVNMYVPVQQGSIIDSRSAYVDRTWYLHEYYLETKQQ